MRFAVRKRKQALWWLLPALLAGALCARLGYWQLDRAGEKRQILQRIEQAPEVALSELTAASPLYIRVSGQASYLDHSLLLDNQVLDGRTGVHVLTPVLVRKQHLLLVNRGWLPFGAARDHLPAFSTPGHEVRLWGRLAPFPEAGLRLGESPASPATKWPHLLTYADRRHIRDSYRRITGTENLQLLPYVLKLDAGAESGFAGRQWRWINIEPAKHLAYAWQWFTLAAAVLVIWAVIVYQGNR